MLTILGLCLHGCTSGVRSSSFRKSLKSIDALTIIYPQVSTTILTVGYNKNDTTLSAKLSKEVLDYISMSLENEYQVKTGKLPPDKNKQLHDYFLQILNYSKREQPKIALPDFYSNRIISDTNRYILTTYIYGSYREKYPPYFVLEKGVAAEPKIIGGTNGLTRVEIKTFLADLKENKVFLYNWAYSDENDPRLSHQIKGMVDKVIEPMTKK